MPVKDENTLYFIYDEDIGASAVYLGTRLITGSGEIQGASNLNELNTYLAMIKSSTGFLLIMCSSTILSTVFSFTLP